MSGYCVRQISKFQKAFVEVIEDTLITNFVVVVVIVSSSSRRNDEVFVFNQISECCLF